MRVRRAAIRCGAQAWLGHPAICLILFQYKKKWIKESKTCPVCTARFVSLGHSSHPEIDGVATLYVQSFPVVYVGLSNLHCAMCLFSLLPTLDMAYNGCLLFIAFRPCRDLKVPLPCTSWLFESCEGTATPTKKMQSTWQWLFTAVICATR